MWAARAGKAYAYAPCVPESAVACGGWVSARVVESGLPVRVGLPHHLHHEGRHVHLGLTHILHLLRRLEGAQLDALCEVLEFGVPHVSPSSPPERVAL